MIHTELYDRDQVQMVSLGELIAEDNPVRVLDLFVDKIDMEGLGLGAPARDSSLGGRPAFRPQTLLKIYLYGYYNRIRSSRKLEAECERNIEMQWLTGRQMPNYHTIADFRKDHPGALKGVFRLFTAFLKEQKLFGRKMLGIDGSKFRAQNSKKHNYNEKKIKKQLDYIDRKTEEYMRELDRQDDEEARRDSGDRGMRLPRREVKRKLKELKERTLEYRSLMRQAKESEDGQVSTTDPESRALIINKNIVEVSYNVQTVVDAKHKLIAEFDTTSRNDSKALATMAEAGAKALGVDTWKEKITTLADKGYHNGEELAICEEMGVKTIVAFREQPSVKHLDKRYLVTNFRYNGRSDTYTCPEGHRLVTNGTWYTRSSRPGGRQPQTEALFKIYTTDRCRECPLRSACTQNKSGVGRVIHRSINQDVIDRNNRRVTSERETYNLRQQICEHPFGTIKRAWGYTYTLLKGRKKVNGEMSLIYLCYNLRRSISILTVKELLKRMKGWKMPPMKPFFRFSQHSVHTDQYDKKYFLVPVPIHRWPYGNFLE